MGQPIELTARQIADKALEAFAGKAADILELALKMVKAVPVIRDNVIGDPKRFRKE